MESPESRCLISQQVASLSFICSLFCVFLSFCRRYLLCSLCAVTKRPRLKSRYKDHVEVAMKHTKTIDDFYDLVDLRTLARHYLNPEPSTFVLQAIAIEEKSEYHHTSSTSLSLSFF